MVVVVVVMLLAVLVMLLAVLSSKAVYMHMCVLCVWGGDIPCVQLSACQPTSWLDLTACLRRQVQGAIMTPCVYHMMCCINLHPGCSRTDGHGRSIALALQQYFPVLPLCSVSTGSPG